MQSDCLMQSDLELVLSFKFRVSPSIYYPVESVPILSILHVMICINKQNEKSQEQIKCRTVTQQSDPI